MKRRGISPIMLAGILALLSALGLIALISQANGALTRFDPTAQQQTVDAIVRTRLTQTAEMRAINGVATEQATFDLGATSTPAS